jgi:hypothetical protein
MSPGLFVEPEAGRVKDTARDHARDFVAFCDGAEEGGLDSYAHRGRQVASDLIRALDELDGERSARRSFQERCERLEEALMSTPAIDVEPEFENTF